MNSQTKKFFRAGFSVLVVILLSLLVSGCAKQSPVVFDSPEAAIQELASLIGKSDVKRLEEVFGPDSADVLLSGDDDQDREDYARVIPLLEKILGEDPHNLDAALRLATAHSALGHEKQPGDPEDIRVIVIQPDETADVPERG